MDAKSFFGDYAPFAIEEQKKTGIPASVTLAQAALESGWGESSLATKAFNFFGIKTGSSWTGRKYTALTSEQDAKGREYKIQADFRAYDNVGESFSDHSRIVTNLVNPEVLKTGDAAKVSQALQDAGYATDKQYATKLQKIITDNDLTKFDLPGAGGYGSSTDYSSSAGSKFDQTDPLKQDWGAILKNASNGILTGLAILLLLVFMGLIGYKAIAN